MKRTINEKKAVRGLFLGTFLFAIGLLMFAVGMKLILIEVTITGWLITWCALGWIVWSAYSLGWEYKRLSLIKEKKQ